ncbi:ARM-repeat/Tetratricopeptide repeat-like protein [Tripterygium wilfordii]|uniref:ARM-repeat/Tetratricopeptide repeat-like protein n=1 Tax=Tripterygium wilfordii TaxID=458696 RepID=A0A7J7CW01_TRIWF|nr:uncharacterized protein LOC120012353 [Tripterygium wilfordii]KAF5738243.1 ARM-repeat/Tetratricopeptide repeat-like protein [Tripterygium wilfordii]
MDSSMDHSNLQYNSSHSLSSPTCTKPLCFFCNMDESDPSRRRSKIAQSFKELPLRDDKENVLVLNGLWKIAMTLPDDPEFPSLGIFECMAKLIHKGITDQDWLLKDQNIYIPYYAAHIIGSYVMNRVEFVEKAVKSGVIFPLTELLRGKISWVEQRVAVRALGHIASHEKTFEAIASQYEAEMIELTMNISCNCIEGIYREFVVIRESNRVKYHCDLLTRGRGGLETENTKAEEWASQLQCWSLYLINCFACKERSLNLICKKLFMEDLCGIWGGVGTQASLAGLGLLRTLCNYKTGRETIANSKFVIQSLCNRARSSDDWQYMAIDCLLLLLKDTDTRFKVIDDAASSLADLTELQVLARRNRVGETITQTLLQDYHKIKYGNLKLESKRAENALKGVWDLKVERRKREKLMSEQELKQRKVDSRTLKRQGNQKFWSGHVAKAVIKYSKALAVCPLRLIKERIVLYSNRAQCYLLLNNPDSAISDTTRALCLSSATSIPHSKSLWRRSQAYDMKGLAKESLIDCFMFINGRMKAEDTKHVSIIPNYAARMMKKQMDATWIFAVAKSRLCCGHQEVVKSDGREESGMMMTTKVKEKGRGVYWKRMEEKKGRRRAKKEEKKCGPTAEIHVS